MSTKRTERVPWRPTERRLTCGMCRANTLYGYRDDDGARWWSDGAALFTGDAPAYLRQAYLSAGLPVAVPAATVLLHRLVRARSMPETKLGLPSASDEFLTKAGTVSIPVDVFHAAPEVHVDARYVAHALSCYEGVTFWRANAATIAVRDRAQNLVGIIPQRPPRPPRARSNA